MTQETTLALAISTLSLAFSGFTFFWQQLRKQDSIICTLVANETIDNTGYFQFSIANLGTRSALIRDVSVSIYSNKTHTGSFIDDTERPELPKVINPGEIKPITISSAWNERLTNTDNKSKEITLYFVAKITLWTPDGKRLKGVKEIATMTINKENRSSSYKAESHRSFRCKKQRIKNYH